MTKSYKIKGKVWLWSGGKAAWHFFTIPPAIANEIHFETKLRNLGASRGFGSIKVKATIGDCVWKTSIFPNSSDSSYLLPIKAAVRASECITAGSEIDVKLEV